jgi:hypothetical protein
MQLLAATFLFLITGELTQLAHHLQFLVKEFDRLLLLHHGIVVT